MWAWRQEVIEDDDMIILGGFWLVGSADNDFCTVDVRAMTLLHSLENLWDFVGILLDDPDEANKIRLVLMLLGFDAIVLGAEVGNDGVRDLLSNAFKERVTGRDPNGSVRCGVRECQDVLYLG